MLEQSEPSKGDNLIKDSQPTVPSAKLYNTKKQSSELIEEAGSLKNKETVPNSSAPSESDDASMFIQLFSEMN